MTKRDLIKVIPNHGKFICNRAESKKLSNHTVLLHAVQRDGNKIWADIEFSDGFGRWTCPFEDMTRDERKYIYESVERTLRYMK